MTVRKLTQGADNKVLRTHSIPVKKLSREQKKLITDMIETMRAAKGIGIAAPQVDVNDRIFIAWLNYGAAGELILPMMNAEIHAPSDEMTEEEEGCLSLPGRYGVVPRHKSLTVEFTDQKGKKQTLHLEGLNARIIQHELDHLDGKLFIDRMIREVPQEELDERKKERKEK